MHTYIHVQISMSVKEITAVLDIVSILMALFYVHVILVFGWTLTDEHVSVRQSRI